MNGISVVIPTYNEAPAIAGLVRACRAEIQPLAEIIVVDDNSPDGTGRVVEGLAAADGRIRLIRRVSGRGLCASLREGIAAASGDFILWLDADFRSEPGTLGRMCDRRSCQDILVASRYVKGGADLRSERLRVIASRWFNLLARMVLGTKARDLTSGQVLCRRETFSRLRLRGFYGEYFIRFLFDAERKGFTVHELPFTALSRGCGESKSAASVLGFIRLALRYAWTVAAVRCSSV